MALAGLRRIAEQNGLSSSTQASQPATIVDMLRRLIHGNEAFVVSLFTLARLALASRLTTGPFKAWHPQYGLALCDCARRAEIRSGALSLQP